MLTKAKIRRILLFIIAILIFLLVPDNQFAQAPAVAVMIALMVFLWVTELLPLVVTSLISIMFSPTIGVGSLSQITAYYERPIIYLFLGGLWFNFIGIILVSVIFLIWGRFALGI